ncbi:MFS transporter [Cryobacterium luteum]|uniref:MFS transporter n=1 Tax=Cryobacterium luteum TaxID=1424661 RepID=A0A1H8GEG0_9MICO|nr:MFS transporter [Cryobacterium luteum]TFB93951.1 MFS transporter [Cryobacterium luteum]SEN42199.1 MFS transporter, DHA1 family, inner membrane transport protein [Cryobacterium luteum]
MPLGLLALAAGGFGIGLTEFVILGLLPEVAADFNVSIPVAGYLVSIYALSVAVGGVILTAATARMNRKTVLVGLMCLFIAGNFISAISIDYSLMMAGRIIAALCHGAFFGIGAVLASQLVTPDRKARAIAVMFAGLTTANVLGVPLGTFLGQSTGWRTTFWAISAIGVVTLIGLVLFVPKEVDSSSPRIGLISELRAFKNAQVWLSVLVTIFGFGAMFGAFTYIAPMMIEVAGFQPGMVSWLLVVFGVGLFVGNLIGGRAADHNLNRTLIGLLVALTVILAAFTLTAHNQWASIVTLFLLGGVGFAAVPGMQMRVLHFAAEAPTLASGVNISAFNLGNAIGAHLGGLTIAAGLGYTSPSWVGAALAGAAVVTMLLSSRLEGRQNRRATTSAHAETLPLPKNLSIRH